MKGEGLEAYIHQSPSLYLHVIALADNNIPTDSYRTREDGYIPPPDLPPNSIHLVEVSWITDGGGGNAE